MYALKPTINCCHCKEPFDLQSAEMCDGCNPCDACRGARSVDEGCYFGNCATHTLTCPHCGKCGCDHIEKWEQQEKIVLTKGDEKFSWVHRDAVSEFGATPKQEPTP